MDIGIGLPNPVPRVPGRTLVDWARRAEGRGFSGLATIDRIAYPSYESLIALAAAAGATTRIGLLTNVLLAPARNPVLLAKEAASLDQLSSGRFTLGLAVGGRPDDYAVTGLDFDARGRRFDSDLELIHRAWKGELVSGGLKPVGPTPVNGERVPILFGGNTARAIERTVRWGIGWSSGGGPPKQATDFIARIRTAWADAGRDGQPRIVGLTYFGLSDRALEAAVAYLGDYYGDFGKQFAEFIPRTPEALREAAGKFEDLGFDELYVDPTLAELEEIDRAADALL